LGLIIGGAVGNLIDRIELGYVVDFIDVHYQGWHWPAFNVADSAITCGVILLLIDGLFLSGSRRHAGDS
jgi:signal peptidase II